MKCSETKALAMAPGKTVQKLAPIQLEGGAEERLAWIAGENLYCGRTKRALEPGRVSFTQLRWRQRRRWQSENSVTAGQTVGTLAEMPGENLGYVDGKGPQDGGSLAAFDVEILMSWQKVCVEQKGFTSTSGSKSSRLLWGHLEQNPSVFSPEKFELGILLKELALFLGDVYNFRQMIQYE